MHKALLASFLCAAVLAVPARANVPRERVSPPGQVSVVTLNARQTRILGVSSFKTLFEIGRALRSRPSAFDGGTFGAVMSPDVVIVQEIRQSNLEILARMLRQRYTFRYLIATPGGTSAPVIYNSDTLDLLNQTSWPDVCTSADGTVDGKEDRSYPILHFTEKATSTTFALAGIHLAKNYLATGQRQCFERNVTALRGQLAGEAGPVIVGGDFNRRPVEKERECDLNERSAPQTWWTLMTSLDEAGRGFDDAVRQWHRENGRTLRNQWTHEQASKSKTCVGFKRNRRSRIDYLFSSGATVAQASADQPGWAGSKPGTRNPGVFKYSDHRFVWGRFVLSGPPPSGRPDADPEKDASVRVTWPASPSASGYVVLRALDGQNYRSVARVPAGTTEYTDLGKNRQRYRYAIAVVGTDGGWGRESRPVFVTADATGPRVVATSPSAYARGVDRDEKLIVRFSDAVDADRVGDAAIRVWAGSRRIGGRIRVLAPRVIAFDPYGRFPGRRTLHARVTHLWDRNGNRGPDHRFLFTTRRGRPR